MADTTRQAYIEIRGPDGQETAVTMLGSDRVTIGRSVPDNCPDVPLAPDPQQLVSRLHCLLEREGGAWWISDNATPNGTFLRHGDDEPEKISSRRRLQDGDVVCILGDLRPGGPYYWELVFNDPFATRRAEPRPTRPPVCIEYDHVQAKLFRRQGGRRDEIVALAANPHQLVRYMVRRSEESGAPAACTHDELIRAVWGDPTTWRHERSYTKENLRDLVSDLRQRLEPDPSHPRVLEAVPGYGYRLVTCPHPEAPPPGGE